MAGLYTTISCSEDENDISNAIRLNNQENFVTIKVYSNNPDSPIVLGAECTPNGPCLTIKEYYEWTVKTKSYWAQIVADCKDSETLMTGEIYVNGRLKGRRQANSHLFMECVVKGHPWGSE